MTKTLLASKALSHLNGLEIERFKLQSNLEIADLSYVITLELNNQRFYNLNSFSIIQKYYFYCI